MKLISKKRKEFDRLQLSGVKIWLGLIKFYIMAKWIDRYKDTEYHALWVFSYHFLVLVVIILLLQTTLLLSGFDLGATHNEVVSLKAISSLASPPPQLPPPFPPPPLLLPPSHQPINR